MSLFATAEVPISQTDYEYTIPEGASEVSIQAVGTGAQIEAVAAGTLVTLSQYAPLRICSEEGRYGLAGQKLYFTTDGSSTVGIFVILGEYIGD